MMIYCWILGQSHPLYSSYCVKSFKKGKIAEVYQFPNGSTIWSLIASGVFYFLLLVILEYRRSINCRNAQETPKYIDPSALEDSDVVAEYQKVQSSDLNELRQTHTLVLKDLTKSFKNGL